MPRKRSSGRQSAQKKSATRLWPRDCGVAHGARRPAGLCPRARQGVSAGECPNNLPAATREFQADSLIGHEGSHTGLYDLRINRDVNVVRGCGLGGTSLINANVGLRAEPRVFEDPGWPEVFRSDTALIEQSYARAERMVSLKPVPDTFPSLPKMNALQTSAAALQGRADTWHRELRSITSRGGDGHKLRPDRDQAGIVSAAATGAPRRIGCHRP